MINSEFKTKKIRSNNMYPIPVALDDRFCVRLTARIESAMIKMTELSNIIRLNSN